MKERYQDRIELLQGTLDLMVLQALRWGPQHGYGISRVIRNHSREALQVATGSLYPALHRLERKGWITSSWEMAKDKNREFKFYRLTAIGKKQLSAEVSKWKQLAGVIASMMRPAEEN
jgi:PadR family transcriptional regulator PadR